jgi:hypothetical protein
MGVTTAAVVETNEKLEGGHVRGWVLRAHLLWLGEYGIDGDFAAVWQEVGEKIAGALRAGFDPDGWYPLAWVVAVDRAIARRFTVDVSERAILEDIGRFSARLNLSMRFARLPNDGHHRFFEETARTHGELQDFGVARYERIRAREGRIVLTGGEAFSPAYCATLYGCYEQCLYLHGAIRVKIGEVTCRCLGDEACTFAMQWR